jgi:two-component system cell cycle sensor histidine kinase/response regulator CckA
MPKILAIDDKMDNLVTLSALLRNLMPECTVMIAESGMEGIGKARAELPDAVLLDVKMPEMDGFETCRRLKADEDTRHIPVIMITAVKTDPQSRTKGLECGANAFLAKPIDQSELVSQVRVALRIKKAEDDLREERRSLENMVQERTAVLRAEITERKRAEEGLRERNELFTLFMNHSPIYSFIVEVTSTESRVLQSSENYRQMIGIPGSEMAGKTMAELFPAELAAKITADNWAVVSNRQVLNVEETFNGRSYTSIKFPIVQREKTLLAGYTIDITDRKRAAEEKRSLTERLQRAEKMEALGQLAGGVAHDLNNVLGILSGYSELLLEEIPQGSRSRGHVEKILQSTEKGAAIIQDLLTLARRGVTASDVVNLNGVVSGFLKTPVFEKMKDYHPRVTFRTECDPNLLNIKGSPVHLEKTLMNLVSNAAESIAGEGEVTIRTESRHLDQAVRGYDKVEHGDYAVLTVSDTGMGIPAENREKIFEPFYTKKTMGRSGTGLGLAIVWGTVKDHNGYVDIQTEVGEGTTFALYFPVTREELIAQQRKTPIERYTGNGESVLVVDDIADQRNIAAGLLTRLGYRVHPVSGGEEAVEYLKENKADILVLDMIMTPGIDGLETYRRILEINPKQKAIIVSGFSETERVKEAQKLGAGAYVKKPYIMEKIGTAIRDELNRQGK